MDKETIIKLADETLDRMAPDDYCRAPYWTATDDELEHFAKLVAEHEREACAKLIEPTEEHRRDASWGYIGGGEGVDLLDNLAAAIRARGNT